MTGSTSPHIYMAPLRGITDSVYRRVYCQHFNGIDAAVTPFINPQPKSGLSEKLLLDVAPENNNNLHLVPQVLNNNCDDLLALGNRLFDMGYREINWNLGCPVPMVAKKKRGSGLLPFPEQITALLEDALPRLKPKLSLKIRLGYHDYQESLTLLPRLKDFPLSEIIIHPRLGKQLYRGQTAPEQFVLCQKATRHQLVYNGDISSAADYHYLNNMLGIDRWMIGRGLIANPFLPSEIKGNTFTDDQKQKTLHDFHHDLYQAMKERLDGPGHLLGRMKQIWIYMIKSFPGHEKSLKKITKAATERTYNDAVHALFHDFKITSTKL